MCPNKQCIHHLFWFPWHNFKTLWNSLSYDCILLLLVGPFGHSWACAVEVTHYGTNEFPRMGYPSQKKQAYNHRAEYSAPAMTSGSRSSWISSLSHGRWFNQIILREHKYKLWTVRLKEISCWWCNNILPRQTFFHVWGKLLNIQDGVSAGETFHTAGKLAKLMT